MNLGGGGCGLAVLAAVLAFVVGLRLGVYLAPHYQ